MSRFNLLLISFSMGIFLLLLLWNSHVRHALSTELVHLLFWLFSTCFSLTTAFVSPLCCTECSLKLIQLSYLFSYIRACLSCQCAMAWLDQSSFTHSCQNFLLVLDNILDFSVFFCVCGSFIYLFLAARGGVVDTACLLIFGHFFLK